jgi:hypothetical protein
MKNLLTNSISTTVGFPVKSGTLDFLQTASSEMLNALGRSIIGRDYSTSIPYALYGCNNTGSGSSYVIQEGAILWGGVLYLVPAVSFTLTGGNAVYVVISQSYVISSIADPVTFTDGVSRNVHSDTKMSVYQNAMPPSPTVGFTYTSIVEAVQSKNKLLSVTTNYSSSAIRYYKNRDGIVMLEGYITCNTGAAVGQTIATLPSGYIPAIGAYFSVVKRDVSNALAPAIIYVDVFGVIKIGFAASIANNDTIHITGLQFKNYE